MVENSVPSFPKFNHCPVPMPLRSENTYSSLEDNMAQSLKQSSKWGKSESGEKIKFA